MLVGVYERETDVGAVFDGRFLAMLIQKNPYPIERSDEYVSTNEEKESKRRCFLEYHRTEFTMRVDVSVKTGVPKGGDVRTVDCCVTVRQ